MKEAMTYDAIMAFIPRKKVRHLEHLLLLDVQVINKDKCEELT